MKAEEFQKQFGKRKSLTKKFRTPNHTHQCVFCGKECLTYRPPSIPYDPKFCSYSCMNKSKKENRVPHGCAVCGTYIRGLRKKFCSLKCKDSAKNRVTCKICSNPFKAYKSHGKILCGDCGKSRESYLEKEFEDQLMACGETAYVRELRFHPSRRWRFDFAWEEVKLAVEIQGGVWLGKRGGHTSGAGYSRDREKHNEANLLGWRVLQFINRDVMNGSAVAFTIQALKKFREI